MTNLTSLEQEIKDLEQGVFNTPSSNEAVKSSQEEVINVAEPEGLQASEPTPEDLTETTEEVITQETVDTDLEVAKPTRTNWKKKYQSLDKRFRNLRASQESTIFELRTDLAAALKDQGALSQRVETLLKEVEELESSKPTDYSNLLTEDEKDIVGAETIDSFKKLNEAAIKDAVAPLKAELEAGRAKRASARAEEATKQAEQANTNFLNRLGELVEDYTDLDVDPEFHTWMGQVDDFSGSIRSTIFHRAKNSGDVGRVAQFFNEFKKTKDTGKETLEEMVTPSATSSTASAVATNTSALKIEYVSMAGVDAFMADVAKGRYKGREKLMREIEAKINAAQALGHIVA